MPRLRRSVLVLFLAPLLLVGALALLAVGQERVLREPLPPAIKLLTPKPLESTPAAEEPLPDSGPLAVTTYRLEKDPASCNSTLVVQVTSVGEAAGDGAIFLSASQIQSLGGTLSYSSFIGSQPVGNLPPDQTKELRFVFIREYGKDNVRFLFKQGPATLGSSGGPLPAEPPLTYAAAITEHQLDPATATLLVRVSNSGPTPIPRLAIGFYTSSLADPETFEPAGGRLVADCLLPDASVQISHFLPEPAALATIRVRLQVGPELLAEKFIAAGAAVPPPPPPTALPRIPQKRR